MPIENAIPREFVAGDTVRATVALGDYPATTWTVTLYAENDAHAFNAVAAASGTEHAFTLSAATTAALVPGRYRYSLRATDGSIVETAGTGWFEVAMNPADAGKADRRSWERQVLDAIRATLRDVATNNQLQMSIGGRALTRYSLQELRDLEADFASRVSSQETGHSGKFLRVRLTR